MIPRPSVKLLVAFGSAIGGLKFSLLNLTKANDAPLPVADYVASLKLYPITVGNKTLGTWSAEFRVTEGREADVVDRIANGTFGKAFEVIDKLLGQ